MKPLTSIACVAWAVIALLVAPARSAEPPPVVGANLVNEPYKQTAQEQEATFQALQSAGVHVIRAGIPDNDAGLAFAQRAYAHGIRIEWLLWISPDPGTPWPKLPDAYKGKSFWRGYPLSTANADAFKAAFGRQLAELEIKGVVLAGFELGNEINWTGFNADFPLPAQGRILNGADLANDPEGRKIAQGYLRYIDTLAALKDVRDHSTFNQRTPILSAGLSDPTGSETWLRSVRADAVSAPATLHFLQAHGLDGLVDGYGLHLYPYASGPGTPQGLAALRAHLEANGLSECQPPGAAKGKPCWITEWNFNGLKGLGACPVDDAMRLQAVRDMRGVFGELASRNRLGGALYYTWQGALHAPAEDHDSAFLCGAVTPSGRLAVAPIAGSVAASSTAAAHAETIKPRPCDIYAAARTPCVAAHSTVRSLYAGYAGALYQVEKVSDSATQNIGLLADGYANAAAQDAFCENTTCIITRIYDQSPRHNDLTIASGGHYKGSGPNGSDLGAAADALPVTAGGHQVYGVSISPGMGYRDNRTSGIAVKGEPEGMYMVSSGTHYNSGCCFDYGNAETSGTDTGAGHMDAVNVSRDLEWPDCRNGPAEPGVQADLENGIFHWDKRSCNPASNVGGGPRPFISAWLKNDGRTRFALKWGDARSGGLNTIYAGALPTGYAPMRQEGAILLGIGGDNSHASAGSFFEGVMTASLPTDSADDAVQADIVAVGYGAPTGVSGTLAPGSEVSLRATTACCTGDFVRDANGAAVISPITTTSVGSDKEDATWIVRRGLGDKACVSFESSNHPGDFLGHQNAALRVLPFDGTVQGRSDATFCPQPGKNGKGSAFQSKDEPTGYIRHYLGKLYVASDGGANPWDAGAHWSDDVSFIVGPPLTADTAGGGAVVPGTRLAPLAPLEFGIDRSNMATQWTLGWPQEPKVSPFLAADYNKPGNFEARRVAVMDGIARVHAGWFRDGLGDPAQGIDLLKLVHARGMKMLAIVSGAATDYPKGAYVGKEQSGCQWGTYPLSKIDIAAFQKRIEAELAAVRAAGETVDAFEIGNELDLYCNDADNPTGADWARHQWKWFLSPAQVQAFTRGYAPFLAASVASIRKYFPQARIITYGNSMPASAPLIEALAHVQGADGKVTDYTRLVDGYGAHLYPNSTTTLAMVQETTGELRVEAAHYPHAGQKPIWITEWNPAGSSWWNGQPWYFQYDAHGQPGGDLNKADPGGVYRAMDRAGAIRAFDHDVLEALRASAAAPVNISHVFYYAYDSGGPSPKCAHVKYGWPTS
ncbi:MAG: alpha-L-arabinofuranosidase B, partial [Pseudomonadota bacterium]